MVHLPDVPHPAGPQVGQEGAVVLVHSLHPAVALRHDIVDIPGGVLDIAVSEWAGQTQEQHHPEGLGDCLHRVPVDSGPDHALHQAGRQWHRHPAVLCHDPSLDHPVIINHCCVPVSL